MNGQHFSGGSIAAVLAFCSARYGWGISDTEAATIGAATFGAAAGLVHLVTGPGIIPAVKRALYGDQK